MRATRIGYLLAATVMVGVIALPSSASFGEQQCACGNSAKPPLLVSLQNHLHHVGHYQKHVQKGTPQKSHVQKGCVTCQKAPQKSCGSCQKSVPQKTVYQKAVPQKTFVPQKGPSQKGCVTCQKAPQKSCGSCQKSVPQKTVYQKAVPQKTFVPQKGPSQKGCGSCQKGKGGGGGCRVCVPNPLPAVVGLLNSLFCCNQCGGDCGGGLCSIPSVRYGKGKGKGKHVGGHHEYDVLPDPGEPMLEAPVPEDPFADDPLPEAAATRLPRRVHVARYAEAEARRPSRGRTSRGQTAREPLLIDVEAARDVALAARRRAAGKVMATSHEQADNTRARRSVRRNPLRD